MITDVAREPRRKPAHRLGADGTEVVAARLDGASTRESGEAICGVRAGSAPWTYS